MGRHNERTILIKRLLLVWQIELAGVDALAARYAESKKEAGIRGAALLFLATALSSATRSLVLHSSIRHFLDTSSRRELNKNKRVMTLWRPLALVI